MLFSFLLLIFLSRSVDTDCPVGTHLGQVLNKCYGLFNNPKNFIAAEQYCMSVGGHLVDIQNDFENSYVAAMTTGAVSTWLGLNYLTSTQWTWTSNASTAYSKLIDKPSDPSADQCAAVNNDNGEWTKELCNAAKPFVCKVEPPPPPPCGTFVCDRFYTQYAGDCKCYKYIPLLGNFNDSVAACARESATLAIILSPEQNAFIANLIGYIDSFVWIGLQCVDSNPGNCKWVDGTALAGFNNFIESNPQGNYGTVMLQYNYANYGKWSASNYNAYSYPLCQKDSYDNS